MKKFILICFFASFILGIAQEKKISFAKEFSYQLVEKDKTHPASVKIYASNNNEYLTRLNIKDFPMYYYTDALATTAVSPDINNRLNGGSGLFSFMHGFQNYNYPDEEEYILDFKKLNTKETILGITCTHYLTNYVSKNGKKDQEELKLCIDDRNSPYNSFPVLNGIIGQFTRNTKIKSGSLKGLIVKLGPEKDYDKEHVVLTSVKDSKDFVYFDHVKAITDFQRKQDSIMLAYTKQQEEYAQMDSAYIDDTAAADPVTTPTLDEDYYLLPDYISEYKSSNNEDGSLAIDALPSEKLWKALPKHCKNIDKELPAFSNKELKGHLKNYVGQMCDMYLTQSSNHLVGIKVTLDEIRREVLYLNEIQDKLDASDKKKLTNYLKNLD